MQPFFQETKPRPSYSVFNLFVATHCWRCGPAYDQDDCDREIEYRECWADEICVAIAGTTQPYYVRGCRSKDDYEWDKLRCERGTFGLLVKTGTFCETGWCSGDCIANVGNEGKQQTTMVANCICTTYSTLSPPRCE